MARRARLASPLRIAIGALVAAALGLAAVASVAERKLSRMVVGGLGESFSTRVYSAPFAVRDGSVEPPERLMLRLKRLGYSAQDALWVPPVLSLRARGFRAPAESQEAGSFSLAWNGESWSVRDSSGAAASLMLEPEMAAELSGARKVRRDPAESAEIPQALKDAVVSAEDKRFRSHWGLDWHGIARAVRSNLLGRGPMQGGSTITQQLSKNLFLSPRRTFRRKLAEAALALYLEVRFGKERILTLYLNHIYLGQDGSVSVAGVKAAAKFYFGKDLKDLSLPECATIAGLIRSPHRYNPFREPDAARQRRDFVLKRMREDGSISEQERALAAAAPLVVKRTQARRERGDADYFVAEVVRHLLPRYGEETLYRHGLSIHTTLDPLLQAAAQRAVSRAKPQGALVALDPRSGAVVALSGGSDFSESQFNRATQARRQPGSAFKPFVYATALEKGLTPAAILEDAPKRYPRQDATNWDPRNYEGVYLGTATMRVALARSLNAATLDLAQQVGVGKIIELAHRLGIESPLQENLAIALGASEVTLIELCSAYAPFANGGLRVPPRLVTGVLDAEGAPLELPPQPPNQSVLSPAVSYLMTSLLTSVVREGTARGLAKLGWTRPAAGKTGTTNDGRDAWFIGYTPALLTGVWVGDDRHRSIRATGAKDAVPVWAAFMKDAAQDSPLEDFVRPEGLVSVKIDPASGLRARSGCPQKLDELFVAGTEPTKDCPLHPGGLKGWLKKLFGR